MQREERAPHTVRTLEKVEVMVIHITLFDQLLHEHFLQQMLERANFLAGLEWFRHWSPHLVRQLAFLLRERRYRFGECLYRQEMYTSGVLLIKSGSVKISSQRERAAPDELVNKIHPPKDYLPEILAEGNALQRGEGGPSASKVSLSSGVSKYSSSTAAAAAAAGRDHAHFGATPTSSRYPSASVTFPNSKAAKSSSCSLLQTNSSRALIGGGPPPLGRHPSTASGGARGGEGGGRRRRRKGEKGGRWHQHHQLVMMAGMLQPEQQLMGFIIHQPSPASIVNICLLGPGDTLCDIEAICKLRKHLFNAVCDSDVVLYELNHFHFELMFEKRSPFVLYQMTRRAQQRVESWGALHSGVQIFGPLGTVLEQIERGLVAEKAHLRARKKQPLYTPDMLAFTAIKGLGKSTGAFATPLPWEGGGGGNGGGLFQIPAIKMQISTMSLPLPPPPPASDATLRPSSPRAGGVASAPPSQAASPFPASPFEPKEPDFEALASMMRHRLRGHRGNKRGIFDSPLNVVRECRIRAPDVAFNGAIPSPSPYPTTLVSTTTTITATIAEKLDSPSSQGSVKSPLEATKDGSTEEDDERKKKRRTLMLSLGEIFAGANDPRSLSRIRTGILFGKKRQAPQHRHSLALPPPPQPPPPAPHRSKSEPCSGEGISVMPWRSKSARSHRLPSLSTPLRSLSCDGRLRELSDVERVTLEQLLAREGGAGGGGGGGGGEEEEGNSPSSRKRTKISFSEDSELTRIPNEYSRLYVSRGSREGSPWPKGPGERRRRRRKMFGGPGGGRGGGGKGEMGFLGYSRPPNSPRGGEHVPPSKPRVPKMKTMEQVIENRTSYLLTK